MPHNPVVVISSPSPLLEGIAAAVLGGATEENPTAAAPVVVADSAGSAASTVNAPFVFLGYRADSEESRRIALKTLTELTAKASTPLHVALFEASARGSSGDPVLTALRRNTRGRLEDAGAGAPRALRDRTRPPR